MNVLGKNERELIAEVLNMVHALAIDIQSIKERQIEMNKKLIEIHRRGGRKSK